LTARHGKQVAFAGPESLATGGRKEVTMRLGAGASVSGMVAWDDGAPTPSTIVMTMARNGGGGRFSVETQTAQDGSFSVWGLPPGEIALRAVPPGRMIDPGRPEPGPDLTSITLKPGEQRTGVKLVVARR
jgi:hypothetical protein